MPARNRRLFWQEFRRTFETTGSMIPSSPALCRALAQFTAGNGHPRRLLECGPGTGVVTEQIVARMGPADTLDIVELNDRFVEALRERFATEPALQTVAERVQIHHLPAQEFEPAQPFDVIVSGVPHSNFQPGLIREVFAAMQRLAAPGATMSFFEYVGLRKLRALVVGRQERQRIAGVEEVFHELLEKWRFDSKCVVGNLPPAWVHHLRFDGSHETATA